MANVFTVNNFPLPAAPPGYFVPDATGRSVPAGANSWQLLITTTGLPNGQPLLTVVVQYHYTSVQLGATGVANQGQVTNTDGTVAQVNGGSFTGWIDDCSAPLNTTFTDKTGATVHQAWLACQLNRIPGAYPDSARFVVLSSPGYANIASASLAVS